MKRERTEGARQRREHALWYSVLTAVLPVFALLLTGAFVLFCVMYGSVRPLVTIELGEQTPEVEGFLRGECDSAAYAVEPEPYYKSAGDYRLYVSANGRAVPVILRVRDTQPPTAKGTETTVPAKHPLTPEKVIRDLRDQSLVKITYETAPDFDAIGDYEAKILLEDASGNSSRVTSTVHVRTVREELVLEAGDPVPTAEDFLIGQFETVEMSPVTEEMLREPDVYPIRITADGITAETRLTVRDTIAPTGRGVTCIAVPGETVLPDMLVADVSDATAVEAAFVTPPNANSLEPQTMQITLTDRGGNITSLYATLLFSNVKPIEIEARRTGIAIGELLEEGTYTEAALDMLYIPNDPGLHVLGITVDGVRNLAVIEVRDTTAPALSVSKETHYLDTPVPADAVVDVVDATDTAVAFVSEPDWMKPTQPITVTAVDTSGNRSELTFDLVLSPDTEPPVLYGVRDRYCYMNETVAFLAEISAQDACDGAVEVGVDASAVDLSRAGNYTVVYFATDRAGNTARKSAVMHVIPAKVDEARATEVAQQILSRILTDDMTLAQQIEAIYDYVYNNVHYTADSNKQDWRSEAVRGLTKGRGDCFTSYAAARLLLEQTDAQTISVQRSGPNTHHYWLLVNIGTGWYHYDACSAWTGKYRCFMFTDADTRRYSKTYWRYDKSLYPSVATEPYRGGK